MRANPAHALDGGMPFLLHMGCHWPAASDVRRWATLRAMNRRLLPGIVSLVAVAVIAGCASNRTVRSQSDFDSLPQSTGMYGGSYIVHTWSYMGSDAHYDHFIYTHTDDNVRTFIHVRVARGVVHLAFETRPYRLPDDGLHVAAKVRDGKIEGFMVSTNMFGP
jgi:hypothetical protein